MKYDAGHDDPKTALSRQRGNELVALFYDLNNSINVIHSAVYMLKIKEMDVPDQDQYREALSRNLARAESMLSNLKDFLQPQADQEIYLTKPITIAELLKEFKNQLPVTAPDEFKDRINQLTRMAETLPY